MALDLKLKDNFSINLGMDFTGRQKITRSASATASDAELNTLSNHLDFSALSFVSLLLDQPTMDQI